MVKQYEEFIASEKFIRGPLNRPHEQLCDRLHAWVAASLPANSALELLPRRGRVRLHAGTSICPDLALVRRSDSQLYLAVEVLQPGDHHADTVLKKQLYANYCAPRLWIVDSRYRNIELYETTNGLFRLDTILACNQSLSDPALSGATYPLTEIFARI